MKRLLVLVVLLSAFTACHKASKEGESCTKADDCEGTLRCVRSVCVAPKAEEPPEDPSSTARILVNNVGEAVSSYSVTHRRLPGSLDDVIETKYMKKNQSDDPWGQPLVYTPGDAGFALSSNGPDKEPGTDDDVCIDKGDTPD